MDEPYTVGRENKRVLKAAILGERGMMRFSDAIARMPT